MIEFYIFVEMVKFEVMKLKHNNHNNDSHHINEYYIENKNIPYIKILIRKIKMYHYIKTDPNIIHYK